MNDLIENINMLRTTPLCELRIKRNLGRDNIDVIWWCKNAIMNAELIISSGRVCYVYYKGIAITVSTKSFTIITAHKICGKVRELQRLDYPCLNEFLYQAIFVPKGKELPNRDIIYLPEIYIYIKDFGAQKGDLGVVAEQNGQVVGAAWTRIISAYGHIDSSTPELAISILPEFRSCGIGTRLMKRLFKLLQDNGYTQTSLSVQKDNPALSFYERLGYEILDVGIDGADHEDCLMIKKFNQNVIKNDLLEDARK